MPVTIVEPADEVPVPECQWQGCAAVPLYRATQRETATGPQIGEPRYLCREHGHLVARMVNELAEQKRQRTAGDLPPGLET